MFLPVLILIECYFIQDPNYDYYWFAGEGNENVESGETKLMLQEMIRSWNTLMVTENHPITY